MYAVSYLRGYGTGVGNMTRVAAAVTATRAFAGSSGEVRNVRTFVGQVTRGCPVSDDAVLLASELATNAIVHTKSGAGGTFAVIVRVGDHTLRVEVHDRGSAGIPAVRRCCAAGESGRGLGLVEAFAARWGHTGGSRGRAVWFEVDWA